MRAFLAPCALLGLAIAGCGGQSSSLAAPPQPYQQPLPGPQSVAPGGDTVAKEALSSAALAHAPFDTAVWVHPKESAKSLVFVTLDDKAGSLVALGLDGKPVHEVSGLNSPKGVDVQYGFRHGEATADLVCVAEAGAGRLRVFELDPKTGKPKDVTGQTRLPKGATPAQVTLYRARQSTHAFASLAEPSSDGGVVQMQLVPAGQMVDAKPLRTFATSSSAYTSLYVDSAKARLYLTEPGSGVRELPADPDSKEASRTTSGFAKAGLSGTLRGLAAAKDQFVCLDSAKGGSLLRLYPRDARGEKPEIGRAKTDLDEASSLEVTSRALGKAFPAGLAVLTDPTSKTVRFFDWRALSRPGRKG